MGAIFFTYAPKSYRVEREMARGGGYARPKFFAVRNEETLEAETMAGVSLENTQLQIPNFRDHQFIGEAASLPPFPSYRSDPAPSEPTINKYLFACLFGCHK